ncbi:hypothetical protein SY2F82_72250 [Streptomyces sp. Y2F8-2]|nr:hypothetical protein [Streptomyces sp. Y2F8-2]GHK05428.1 hypothetical protein SY2F82_72250 [Streptomyces sp. Y2F8-2]
MVNGLIKEYAKSWNKRNRVKKAPAIPDDKFRAMGGVSPVLLS